MVLLFRIIPSVDYKEKLFFSLLHSVYWFHCNTHGSLRTPIANNLWWALYNVHNVLDFWMLLTTINPLFVFVIDYGTFRIPFAVFRWLSRAENWPKYVHISYTVQTNYHSWDGINIQRLLLHNLSLNVFKCRIFDNNYHISLGWLNVEFNRLTIPIIITIIWRICIKRMEILSDVQCLGRCRFGFVSTFGWLVGWLVSWIVYLFVCCW